MITIYSDLNTNITSSDIINSVNLLCNPIGNSLSEKISKINRKIIAAVGSQMAEHYVVSGFNAQPRIIGLDRSLVDFQ